MSAIAAARVNSLGGESPSAVLSGVTTAIWVNAALCVLAAVLIVAFLPSRATGKSS
jgi:hypothetical protein